MLVHVHPVDPQPRNIRAIAECLRTGGVIIYPTDTIYGLGCDILQHKAVERICQLKQMDPAKIRLSFVCGDLSDLSRYCKSISTPLYRVLRSHLPGPYTFILPASREVPRILKSKKDTVGLRVPDHKIAQAIIRELGRPVLSVSLPGDRVEDYTDPEVIHEKFGNQVDMVVDGGIGGIIPSTILDCTQEPPVLLRQGLGAWETE
jgi:tRNA threonylcarbamoyl adenosine modification protein (Sua5/YciO/YrdC/YwlC family)